MFENVEFIMGDVLDYDYPDYNKKSAIVCPNGFGESKDKKPGLIGRKPTLKEKIYSKEGKTYRLEYDDIIDERKNKLEKRNVYLLQTYNHKFQYVIHTYIPKWHGHEEDQLIAILEQTFELAIRYGIECLGIPMVGTGARGWSVEKSAEVVKEAYKNTFGDNSESLKLTVFARKKEDLDTYKNIFDREDYRMQDDINPDNEWAIVLAGGGAKGAYEIGALQALEDFFDTYRGIGKIKALSGTSVGGLNAALYATNGIDEARRVWIEDVDNSMLPHKLSEIAKTAFLKEPEKKLKKIIDSTISDEKIKATEKWIFVVAHNQKTNNEESFILNNEPIERVKDVLVATAAIPKIFTKQNIDRTDYSDGGDVDNVPIKAAYRKGFRKFIVVHLKSIKEAVENKKRENVSERYWNGGIFIHLFPEKDMGNLLEGTLNLDEKERWMKEGKEEVDKALQYIISKQKEFNDLSFDEIERHYCSHDFKNNKAEIYGSIREMMEKKEAQVKK